MVQRQSLFDQIMFRYFGIVHIHNMWLFVDIMSQYEAG